MGDVLQDGGRVSILSRPEGRELLTTAGIRAWFEMFQSSPNPKVGSCSSGPEDTVVCHEFQSAPDPTDVIWVAHVKLHMKLVGLYPLTIPRSGVARRYAF